MVPQGFPLAGLLLLNLGVSVAILLKEVTLRRFDRLNVIFSLWVLTICAYNATLVVDTAAPSWLPFAVDVDPDSPTGRDDFHHPIYRSDLASLMNIVLQEMASVTEESYEGLVTVGKRQAHQVVLHTKEIRVVLAIDTENLLPLAIEEYDRDSGLLVDGGYFEQLEPNPPLDDSLFRL